MGLEEEIHKTALSIAGPTLQVVPESRLISRLSPFLGSMAGR